MKKPVDPAASGTVVEVQPEPFQNSASGWLLLLTLICPTNMHEVGAPQDRPIGFAAVAPVGSGRLAMVQDEPFHCSVIGPGDPMPPAMHHETDKHETPVRIALVVVAAFTKTTDQDVPFHCSMSGEVPPENGAPPTATQNEVVTQETSVRVGVDVAPVTVGSVSSGPQVVPFQVCAW
jgi:hypothetical protein